MPTATQHTRRRAQSRARMNSMILAQVLRSERSTSMNVSAELGAVLSASFNMQDQNLSDILSLADSLKNDDQHLNVNAVGRPRHSRRLSTTTGIPQRAGARPQTRRLQKRRPPPPPPSRQQDPKMGVRSPFKNLIALIHSSNPTPPNRAIDAAPPSLSIAIPESGPLLEDLYKSLAGLSTDDDRLLPRNDAPSHRPSRRREGPSPEELSPVAASRESDVDSAISVAQTLHTTTPRDSLALSATSSSNTSSSSCLGPPTPSISIPRGGSKRWSYYDPTVFTAGVDDLDPGFYSHSVVKSASNSVVSLCIAPDYSFNAFDEEDPFAKATVQVVSRTPPSSPPAPASRRRTSSSRAVSSPLSRSYDSASSPPSSLKKRSRNQSARTVSDRMPPRSTPDMRAGAPRLTVDIPPLPPLPPRWAAQSASVQPRRPPRSQMRPRSTVLPAAP